MPHYIKKFFRCLLLRHLTPFDWKFLQIGTHRAKDLRKIPSKLQNGELTPVPLTLLVIRVVLLLWSYGLSILSVHNCILPYHIRLFRKGVLSLKFWAESNMCQFAYSLHPMKHLLIDHLFWNFEFRCKQILSFVNSHKKDTHESIL